MAPPRQRRHPGAEDLAVEWMRERHVLATAVDAQREKSRPIERLELLAADDRLEGGQADRLPHGEDVERGPCRLGQRGEARRHDLVEPRRGGERARQSPDTALIDEAPTVDTAEYELADEQHVALARGPDLPGRAPLDRATEDEMQQGLHGRSIEVLEIDAPHPSALPHGVEGRRHLLAGARRGDQEDES